MSTQTDSVLTISPGGAVQGSLAFFETGLFGSLSNIVSGSKQWVLTDSMIGSFNPTFNAIGGLLVLDTLHKAYLALVAKNSHRGLTANLLQSAVTSSLIGVVVFGADVTPAIGAYAPYVFASVILANALVAAVQSVRYHVKASQMREQLIVELTASGKLTDEMMADAKLLESTLQKMSPVYTRMRREAKQQAWRAARGIMTSAAIVTILIFGAATGPVAGAVMGALTAVMIGSFIGSFFKKQPATRTLISRESESESSDLIMEKLKDYDTARLSVTGFEHKVDYARFLRENPDNAKQKLLAILDSKEQEYRQKVQEDNAKWSFFRNGALQKKVDMIADIKELLNHDNKGINQEALNAIHQRYQGSLLTRGALSSWNKRFGGMQSVLEAVELFVVSEERKNTVGERRQAPVDWKYADRLV